MTLHKLTAGSGYDYLTRQVAVQDTTEKGRTSLASYYSDKGESPGVWVGSGLKNLDGIQTGDVVTESHLKALFAFGHHPLAAERVAALGARPDAATVRHAQRLGTPFKVHEADASSFQVEVARRIAEFNASSDRAEEDLVDLDSRARVRTQVAREYFERENGRQPADAREIAATVARHARPKTTAVAGYDLTFSPVKSVSALWAVADIETATKIERAHQLAVRDALTFIEENALFTREGSSGVRQVNVTGLVAAAFTHRDSRAGDPDLHTHVATSNKVQTLAGRWLAIDGRVLFKANVTASETYNTALESHLGAALGVRFAERPGSDPHKRPVREIVGVPAVLNTAWSSRRASIELRTAELARDFQSVHSRPPSPVESIQLAQRATLETRDSKHELRSFADQRATWRSQAIEVLGSATSVDRVVARVVNDPRVGSTGLASRDLDQLADRVVKEVMQRRATWQVWHLRAEAQRQIRNFGIAPSRVERCVSEVVMAALDKSVLLSSDRDGIQEPVELRRVDGTSVFHVAGSDVFTSQPVLDSERRIVSAAGRTDGRRATDADVDMAVLESAANGVDLNAGQMALVRGMATSGARVQLGIAAAGTGKTTAMSALTKAWEESGGDVVGLAPSAAAAGALGEQTGATVDTLAKLVHHITKGDSHPLADTIGADTMVLIDEAGMADTIGLDTAIAFILDKGASVRLVGDDQQLAAIGAGGVLRDIDHQHGALRLNELMRFADPAEGAATLALRDGRTEALGYYLDNGRIDVGDLGTSTDAVFDGWSADTAMGLNSIMLAPTRDLVAELNARARTARLDHAGAGALGSVVWLADGNEASAGDIIITRQNDRRLGVSATDWVKNGDRWTVLSIDGGRLSVRHTASNLRTTLPAGYVEQHTELGYASTVHTAQGISVDTMHGLVTGQESCQQFYTMMTRGRHSNHAYLVVASDGDPHNLIRPETVRPRTPTDMLESIVRRDGSPRSATTMAREAAESAARLGAATTRYVDALHQAAETVVGIDRVTALEEAAEKLVPGIGDEPAWPTLRSRLLLAEAMGQDSLTRLGRAVAERELDGVDDRAAILDWRLDPTGHRGFEPGPLPWLPAVPAQLGEHPAWGEYLRGRADRVRWLAADVRGDSTERPVPTWARQGAALPAPDVLADVMVWRAATGVEPEDRRPTGPPQIQRVTATFQRRLNERVNAGKAPALAEWGPLIDSAHPRRDQFTPLLAERLAAISRTGVDAAHLFAQAISAGPLPDDHGAAALWWRISRRLYPAVAAEPTNHGGVLPAGWEGLLVDVLGEEESALVTASPWWPTLVASIDQATQRGWAVPDLLSLATTTDVYDVDLAQALVWRIAIVTDPPPEPDPFEYPPPPEEFSRSYDGNDIARTVHHASAPAVAVARRDDLAAVGLARKLMSSPEPTDRDIDRALERAHKWDHSPVTGPRILAINSLTAAYFETQLNGSWAKDHLLERLATDISGDPRFRPGYAPDGWTNLVNHLHRQGVTDGEMLAAGVATTASTGNLIDRFRDRAILPIISDGNVLGFVGRRHPDTPDGNKVGPKYLNTSDTIAFHKGAQLFGIADDHVALGAVPVLVEGPLDAIAVTVATGGAFVGVAPLGTSLTTDQAAQLAGLGANPVVATDGDLAGRMAAERDYWLLTPHLLEPRFARLKAGEDPASILQDSGPTGLVVALQRADLLSDHLLQERATNISNPADLVRESAQVIAARPSHQWGSSIAKVARLIDAQPEALQAAVMQAATDFNRDRRRFSDNALLNTSDVRTRIERATNLSPVERWTNLARTLDPRLPRQRDWLATVAMLQQINDAGHDVVVLTRRLVDTEPLGDAPARDLRYLLVGYLPEADQPATISPERPQLHGTEQERKTSFSAAPRPEAGPRR